MKRHKVRARRILRPARIGWALSGAGALVLVLLTVLSDPASAGETTRLVATTAFAAAQLGLMIVAFAVFRRLYVRSATLGRRKYRIGRGR